MKNKKEIEFKQPSDILLLANRFLVLIMAFIILAILILGYFFILKPKINSISSVQIENTYTEERKVKNELLLTKLKELEAEYQDIMTNRQADLDSLKSIVPHGSQVPELFVAADTLATNYGFKLINIDVSESATDKVTNQNSTSSELPEASTKQVNLETTTTADHIFESTNDILANTGIKALVVHLTISKVVVENDSILGSEIYDNFKDYISALENNIRLLDVQALNFSSLAATGVANYTFKLDLITYYQ